MKKWVGAAILVAALELLGGTGAKAAEVGPGSGTQTTQLNVVGNGDTVTVNSGGAITPAATQGPNGVNVTANNVVVTNQGVISSAPDAVGLFNGDAAVYSVGNNLTVNNNGGTISGLGGGHAVFQYNGAALSLTNSGTITSATSYGVYAFNSQGNITNSGTVSGTYGIVFNNGYFNSTVTNTGTIIGTTDEGVWAGSTNLVLTNSGTIYGARHGVYLRNGNLTVNNTGTIQGGAFGIFTGNLTLTNSGSIIAGGAYAIRVAYGFYSNITLLTGSNIQGRIYGGGAYYGSRLTLDGSGALNYNSGGFAYMTKSGSGTWSLNNTHRVGNATYVNGGTLEVNGSLYSGYAVVVASGATLSGSGYINVGGVYVTGTIRPGTGYTTPGNLYVNGNVNIYSGGALASIITSPTTANQLNLSGNLNFYAGSVIRPLVTPGSTAKGTSGTVTIANAGSGVFGTAPVESSATLQATAIFNPNDVQLTFTSLFYRDLALTKNQRSTANNLDIIWGSTNGYSDNPNNIGFLLKALDGVPTAGEFRRALDQLHPEFYDAHKEIFLSNNDAFIAALLRRMQESRYGLPDYGFANIFDAAKAQGGLASNDMSAAMLGLGGMLADGAKKATEDKYGDASKRFAFHALGFGHFGERDTDRSAAGLRRTGYEFHTGGFQFAADYRWDKMFNFGLTAGFSQTWADIDQNNSDLTASQFSIGPYVSFAKGGFFADGVLLYGHQWWDTQRHILFTGFDQELDSDHEGNSLTAYAGGGYLFKRGHWSLGPTASLRYTGLWQGNFTERGGAAALHVRERDTASLRGMLGGRAAYEFTKSWGRIIPEVRANWAYDALGGDRDITARFVNAGAGAFTVEADETDRHSAVLGAGLTIQAKKNVSASLNYEAQVGRPDEILHSVNAGFRVKF